MSTKTKNTLKIKKGWYFGAGSVYGWKKDGYHIHGVGIARKYFDEPTITLEIDGTIYTLDSKEGKEFINKYKSFSTNRGVTIGVVSRSLLKAKGDFSEDVEWFDNL